MLKTTARKKDSSRQASDKAEFSKMIRDAASSGGTSLSSNRYDHHQPLVEYMYQKALTSTDNDLKAIEKGYIVSYNGHELSSVTLNETGWYWHHGRSDLTKIWPHVEILQKEIFSMDSKDIQKNPKLFYDKLIELIWLVGQGTPLLRGTGRVLELWLALVHEFHGLKCPILKPDLQLDCLDITFGLPQYKEAFLRCCEFNSLDPCVQTAFKKELLDTKGLSVDLSQYSQLARLNYQRLPWRIQNH